MAPADALVARLVAASAPTQRCASAEEVHSFSGIIARQLQIGRVVASEDARGLSQVLLAADLPQFAKCSLLTCRWAQTDHVLLPHASDTATTLSLLRRPGPGLKWIHIPSFAVADPQPYDDAR